ncbi:hypothetical protein HF329_15850 [Chitinophaga oryzae]|uniref:Tail specific protease domain-containing protein n=1 Tax=Chitinophaga oryzae TaxID=2725414 RepID=A0AAE6ZH90_9BACT|nr:hypothetical protein [Chitinophaga oryzae]QJB32713.1 hypothetical protein HF329_15850 [Chitinophaga oryzae]
MLLRKNCCRRGGLYLLLYALLCSCGSRNTAPGGRDMPDRTMLPDHHIPDLGEDRDENRLPGTVEVFPFTPRYFEWQTNGSPAKFMALSLPDATADQEAVTLVDRYQLLAPMLIHQWASRRTGIVIDLRNNGDDAQQAAYRVQASTDVFPVILVWDDSTASRADRYMQWITSMEYIQKAEDLPVNDSLLLQLPSAGMPDRQLLQDVPVKNCLRRAMPAY